MIVYCYELSHVKNKHISKIMNGGQQNMFTERNDNQLLSVEEVCQQLFTSPSTVYKLLRAGEIKGFRVGSWKIPSESVRDYIKRKCS